MIRGVACFVFCVYFFVFVFCFAYLARLSCPVNHMADVGSGESVKLRQTINQSPNQSTNQSTKKNTKKKTGGGVGGGGVEERLKYGAQLFFFPSCAVCFADCRACQEDAHEFLRHLLDRMVESCLSLKNVKAGAPNRLAETTSINRIFGGYLRSQVGGAACYS